MDYMGKRLVHTPEGVRDIYGSEYAAKQNIEKLFHDKLHSCIKIYRNITCAKWFVSANV